MSYRIARSVIEIANQGSRACGNIDGQLLYGKSSRTSGHLIEHYLHFSSVIPISFSLRDIENMTYLKKGTQIDT